MTVCGYARLSKADRGKTETDQRASVRLQREAIARYCEFHGLDLGEVYEDFGITGSDEGCRPAYMEMRAALDAGEHDAVVVTRLDRLSREADVLLSLMTRHRWAILATEQSLDTGTSSGWLAAAMQAVLAEHERRLISERTTAALAAKRREGKRLGEEPKIVGETAALIVSLASAQCEQRGRVNCAAIARDLTAREVPTARGGSSWNHVTVRRVLVREGVL